MTADVTVVVPKAEFLDANTSREFRDELPAALGAGGKVVLDLRHVQFARVRRPLTVSAASFRTSA